MNLKTRLAKLEARINVELETIYCYRFDGVFSEEQQARKKQAESEGVPVQIIEYRIIE